jgi:hypothetical protein
MVKGDSAMQFVADRISEHHRQIRSIGCVIAEGDRSGCAHASSFTAVAYYRLESNLSWYKILMIRVEEVACNLVVIHS